MAVIQNYTRNILKKQLKKFGVFNNATYEIINDIELHLNSFIKNYNDSEFRKAILMIASEEGSFYEPKNEEIANMVVLTIRNSLLEKVCSIDYKNYALNVLENENIKEITSTAIEYFSKVNLENESKNINIENNFYREIANKYPISLQALIELSKCTEENNEHEYKPIHMERPYDLPEFNKYLIQDNSENKSVKVYESGIASEINESLCNFIKNIINSDSHVFLTDCFKMTSRNFETILRIIECLLTHNKIFITYNYLLSNNYVARRKKILKASHNFEDGIYKVSTLPEISTKYKELLESIIQK